MNKLSEAHRKEIMKRMMKKESPVETNMGEQTPPNMNGLSGMPAMNNPVIPGMGPPVSTGMPAVSNMPNSPNGQPSIVPPMQIENGENPNQNPQLDLGNQLVKQSGIEQLLQSNKNTELTPIDEIIKHEANASQIWKIMGGYESVAGKYWQQLSEKSKLYDSGRDYFIHSYSKYLQNPDKFKKTNMREGLLLDNINRVMEDENG